MIKRILFFGYGIFSYLIFLGTFLYAIGFIGNFGVPTSTRRSGVRAARDQSRDRCWPADAFRSAAQLDGAQVVQGSGGRRIVPKPIERATYVLFSSLALILLFALWRPLGGVVWSVEDPTGRVVLRGLFAFGWGLILYSTFLINHFDLFGMRQVWRNLARPAGEWIAICDARSVPAGATSALCWLALRVLDDAVDDVRALAVLDCDDGLHSVGDSI